jgi:predicted lysophospholipase L1 biosynthesis ABC-type transport system permease subunit
VIWLRARSEWRRHRLALCALTLLIGLTGAVVLTATAGARRTRSSIDRAARITRNVDGYAVLGNDSTLAQAGAITKLPEVAVGRRLALMQVFSTQGFAVVASPVDAGFGTDLLRSRVLRGRVVDPDNADEVALSESTASAFGVDVGGTFELASPSTAQWTCLTPGTSIDSPLCHATAAAVNRDRIDLSKLQGPHARLHVVGITRNLFEVGASSQVTFFNILTPAFYRKYAKSMQWEPMAMVRYRPGTTDAQFDAAVAKAVPRGAVVDSGTFTSVVDALRSTAGVLANGLLVFAVVAALVGLVLLSQVLARYAERGTDEREVLRVFGASRTARIADACVPIIPVAVAGAGLGVLGAWLASGWMPIGTARRAEVARGLDFDAAVLLGGALALAVVVLFTSAAAAVWVSRDRISAATPRSKVARRITIGGVTTTTAASMVTHVGRGRRAIPLRSAVAGIALATAGLIGVAVFSGSLTRLTTQPAREGYAWDALIKGFGPNDAFTEEGAAAAVRRLTSDPDVAAVTGVWVDYLPHINGHQVPGFAEQFVAGHTGFVVVRGRAPEGPDEVALGAKTMRHAGLAIGDEVDVEGKRVRVVGTTLFPITNGQTFALADGALFTRVGVQALKLVASGGEGPPQLAVSFRPGADRAAVRERMRAFNNGELPAAPIQHAEIQQLRELDRLPWVLAGFLIAIALLAVGHLIVLSVRRRAHDFAVLRALGCTPRQVDRIVAWQATMLAIVGTVVGAPLGILFGRFVWTRIADAYGVRTDTAWPWVTMAIALIGTVALANVIAWLPARRAGQRPVVETLRTE